MKDLKHYLSLAAILSVGFGLFWVFNFNRQAQVGVTLILATAYVAWGIVHHKIKKDFHWRVALEYLIVAGVASLLMIFLLLRA